MSIFIHSVHCLNFTGYVLLKQGEMNGEKREKESSDEDKPAT